MTFNKIVVQVVQIAVLLSSVSLFGQGLSTSVLIPKNGNIGIPVSPVSIRGVGIGETAGIESGFTFYSIPGLHLSGLDFKSDKPLVGQSYMVLLPAELFFKLPLGQMAVKFMAGGFFNWKVASKLNEGNLDRALLAYENWLAVTSDVEMNLKSGYGLMGGIELEFHVSKQFSITTECQYLYGANSASLNGSYTGGDALLFETKTLNARDLKTHMQGLELSVGVKLTGK